MGKQFARSGAFGYDEGSHPGGTTARHGQADRPELRTVGPALSGVNRVGPTPRTGVGQRAGTRRTMPPREFSPCPSPDFAKLGDGDTKNRVKKRNLRQSFVVRLPYPPTPERDTVSEPPMRESALRKDRAQGDRGGDSPERTRTGTNRTSSFHRHDRPGAGRRRNNGQSGLIRTQSTGRNARIGRNTGNPVIRPGSKARGANRHPNRRRRNAAEELDA
jgi:hypothetical protein